MDKNKLKTILIKADKLQKGKEIATAKEFLDIAEKIDKVEESVANISEELKKKLELELNYEVDEEKIVDSVLSKVKIPEPIKGKDGKDYILTDKDKKEISKSIKVPVIEKIIEKTEVIRETPIITNEIKEVAITDSAEVIVEKINELPLEDDKKIDFAHIKNTPEFKENKYYGGSGIKSISASGTNVHIDNSNLDYPVISVDATVSFETVSKNILSYPYVPTYLVNGLINYITYTVGTGTIVKTYNYSGNLVSSIVLSGDTPAGISLTKTFNYTGSVLTSITYS